MRLPAVCRKCGKIFHAELGMEFHACYGVEIRDATATCPYPGCNGIGDLSVGTYTFAGSAISVFTSPEMTRAKVEEAKKITADAKAGVIGTPEALRRLTEIDQKLGELVKTNADRRIDWSLVLAAILAIYTIWTDQKSDADAQAALAEARTQSVVAQRMLEESRAQSASLRELATRQALQPPAQAQTNATKNRAQRRKASAIERRAASRGE